MAAAAGGHALRRRTPSAAITSDAASNVSPAISPDGKLIAYASDRAQEGTTDIWVQQVAGGEPVRLTKGLGLCHSPSFSPDGSRIAFHGGPDSKGIFVTSTLGGGARRIADGRAPEFSPDGTTLAYMAADSNRIMVVPAMGGTPRELQTKHTVLERAHWLPDSKRLLFLGVDPGAPNPNGERREDWYTISLDGAEASAGAVPWLNDPFDRVGTALCLVRWRDDVGADRSTAPTSIASRSMSFRDA